MARPVHPVPFREWIVQLRRYFHQFPELAYREEKTAARIAEVLRELGVPFTAGVGGTGVVAHLSAERPGPAVALRADMDALPLEEANQTPYRSQHAGLMHACGHDGHIAMALGVVRWLIEEDWPAQGAGTVLFIFQPAEEGGAGALAMLNAGIPGFEALKAIFAMHLFPELPTGQIGLTEGVGNAASDAVSIRLIGKGGHGAHPNLCRDPIVAGAHFITQIQSIISRHVSPTESAVMTIGSFHAGTARNIIPNEAVMEGTLRTLNPQVREAVAERLSDLLKGLEISHQMKAEFSIEHGYPLLVNDAALVRFIAHEAQKVIGEGGVQWEAPSMGAEDFAYFLQKCPGALIRLGCHEPGEGFTFGLHSPSFDFDENALEVGVRLMVHLLTHYEAHEAGVKASASIPRTPGARNGGH